MSEIKRTLTIFILNNSKMVNQANNGCILYKDLILSHELNNISHYFLSIYTSNSTIIYKDSAVYKLFAQG